MLPLHDDNPTTLRPVVTIGLMAFCIVVFLYQASLSPLGDARLTLAAGVVPARLFGAGNPFDLLTLVTCQYLHGGFLHLGGNLLYLWIFGNNVEDALGHRRFFLFYTVCGVVASLVHAASDPASTVPLIGASGAISGVLGAYLLLYPRARVLVWIGIFIVRLPAFIVLGLWFAFQVGAIVLGGGGSVAWGAHVGGFVAGLLLIIPMRRRGMTLWQPAQPRAPVVQRTRARSRVPVSGGTPPSPPPRRRGPWG
ncbi:rhomboid family intramembrane serine protease [Pararhodospirillum oryzae]|uniref:Rhomboid family intramembrane serine protease n=1 Tax=Pararhodospirillum oryzae TaxID=478448 RepID=A0A512HBI1_9PROT|nr:rhomboid family intramembrane serine protease [Pararhodospirillum oryzae]GEO82798.1 rhomboid family intramembrane serine protease [Pararhodospirillum oryzae]